MRRILIAGASGFIGRALIENLLKNEDLEIIGLSRSQRVSSHPRLSWMKCDLFSLKDITHAMNGCEEAYYLVHSMVPSAALSQGAFYDFDLIMADNFIRAAKFHHLKHIIYLGGMIPVGVDLSWHLKSRLEVEETLRKSGIKTTVLRAGLIIGPDGSSFTILTRLIKRLPVMICPDWTKARSRPIALKDVLGILQKCFYRLELQGKIYDIAGPETLTYQELILKAAVKIKRTTHLYTLNIIPLKLSRLWVTLVTGVSKNLVYPLILSLKYEMLPSPRLEWPFPEDMGTSVDEALDLALCFQNNKEKKRPSLAFKEKEVRSVQRLILPPGRRAEWVASEYFHWLPYFFSTIIKVRFDGNRCIFYLIHPSIEILILERSLERSAADRQILYVVGGLLAASTERGRLEFREVLDHKYIIAALHEFRPSLPWYIYRYTQALIHLLVMRAFNEHLKWHYISDKKVSL